MTERAPNLPRMKKLIMTALLCTMVCTPATAADCIEKACIDVYTQDGKIVIEGRKGTGPAQRKVVAPPKNKPQPKKPVARKSTPAKPPGATTKKPIVRKPQVPPKPRRTSAAAGTSLSDKLFEMLPTSEIFYSPTFEPLIKVPVYFWSSVPEVVTKKIEIVGEIVEVQLKPTFIWHYGDGIVFVTRRIGGPYPDGEIRHTYSNPGNYLVELITSWDGDFTVQGVKARIPGEIKTVAIVPIKVVAAPTRFTPSVSFHHS
jgi:hypothetical protein